MKKLIGIILLVLIACISPEDKKDAPPDLSNTAQKGDLASVNFIMRLENLTIVDTNNADLAKEHNLVNYIKGPFAFIIGQSGKIPGFDQAIIGMKVGEKRDSVIVPSENEIVLTLDKMQGMKRSVQLPLKRVFKLSAFQNLFGKPPAVGNVVFNPKFSFRYQVLEVSNSSVLTRAVVTEGKEYQLEGLPWKSKLLSTLKKEDIGMFMHVPEINKTFESEFGPARVVEAIGSKIIVEYNPQLNAIINKSIDIQGLPIAQKFQVISMDNETFTIKRYGVLTDKKLLLSVELLNLTKDVKEIKTSAPLFETVT